MNTLNLSDSKLNIGTVFTPKKWAEFAIDKFNLFEKWLDGATIFDPTMGEGNLLFALIEKGISKGYQAKELPIRQLYGVEINKNLFNLMIDEAKKYNIVLPKDNYWNEDIFFRKQEKEFDILFGNPPWQNFTDLPEKYKPKIKGQFFLYDLVGNAQNLLLGGSRIDIASLVLQKTIQKNLVKGGEAIFFAPLSLLLNDGANKSFRKYRVNGIDYCIDRVFDFNDLGVFDGIATRYGLIHILRDQKQKFPINYERWENGFWKKLSAKPIIHIDDPLSIFDEKLNPSFKFNPIVVKEYSQPRQGVNTCGANQIFFFNSAEKSNNNYLVKNKQIEGILPKQYLYPLIVGKNFSEKKTVPQKWVLLPYNQKNGKPLSEQEIKNDKLLWKYFQKHKNSLCNRKGLLINTWIKKGVWWALLGAGKYNFSPYKVVWESYGKKLFAPKIFPGRWQANQSLQAFMPAPNLKEAKKIFKLLSDGKVEKYLLSHKMEGTMNWAQPGKIKNLLKIESETQMSLPV